MCEYECKAKVKDILNTRAYVYFFDFQKIYSSVQNSITAHLTLISKLVRKLYFRVNVPILIMSLSLQKFDILFPMTFTHSPCCMSTMNVPHVQQEVTSSKFPKDHGKKEK